MSLLRLILTVRACVSAFPLTQFLTIKREPAAFRTTADMVNGKDGETNFWQGVSNLWNEVIEVSTYGPSERRILKDRRKQKAEREAIESGDFSDDMISVDNFRAARERQQQSNDDKGGRSSDFDGYALRDLLVSKWGLPLDVDLQRRPGRAVCCTVMPIVFGSRKCRHMTELDYLMHLQGVVEILDTYDNLDLFIDFVRTTKLSPSAGTNSVPFLLALTEEELDKIL